MIFMLCELYHNKGAKKRQTDTSDNVQELPIAKTRQMWMANNIVLDYNSKYKIRIHECLRASSLS